MAWPAKMKVDCFPHVTHTGKTIAFWGPLGNDGYAFWFKLLELPGDSNRSADWEYLLSNTLVAEPVALAILNKGSYRHRIVGAKNRFEQSFCQQSGTGVERRKCEAAQLPFGGYCLPFPATPRYRATGGTTPIDAREARRMVNGSPPVSVAGWRPGYPDKGFSENGKTKCWCIAECIMELLRHEQATLAGLINRIPGWFYNDGIKLPWYFVCMLFNRTSVIEV